MDYKLGSTCHSLWRRHLLLAFMVYIINDYRVSVVKSGDAQMHETRYFNCICIISLLYIFITTAPTDYSICIDILGHKITLPTINKGFARALLGPICVSAGITINWLRLKPTSIRPVIFFAVLLIVTRCIMGYHDIALAILPRSIGVVLIAVLLPQVKINSSSLRQQSMWMYYSHMYCVIILMYFQIHFHIAIEIYELTAVILSLFVGWILTKISDIKRFNFLRVLIS